jgi:hypothetical protein
MSANINMLCSSPKGTLLLDFIKDEPERKIRLQKIKKPVEGTLLQNISGLEVTTLEKRGEKRSLKQEKKNKSFQKPGNKITSK